MIISALQIYKKASQAWEAGSIPVFRSPIIRYKNKDNFLKLSLFSHPLKTIFQHKACTDKLYADSFYKVQKNSHSSFEVICCRR